MAVRSTAPKTAAAPLTPMNSPSSIGVHQAQKWGLAFVLPRRKQGCTTAGRRRSQLWSQTRRRCSRRLKQRSTDHGMSSQLLVPAIVGMPSRRARSVLQGSSLPSRARWGSDPNPDPSTGRLQPPSPLAWHSSSAASPARANCRRMFASRGVRVRVPRWLHTVGSTNIFLVKRKKGQARRTPHTCHPVGGVRGDPHRSTSRTESNGTATSRRPLV